MRISDWSSDVCSSDLAVVQEQSGPFGRTIDTRQRTGYNLWPSEIAELQAICSTGSTSGRAFEVDTMPASAGVHGVYGVDYVRSEERRVGKECVSTCRSRWSSYH